MDQQLLNAKIYLSEKKRANDKKLYADDF